MTDGTHAMRGCEPCQGRKAAAISIVSCVPWEFSAPSILRLRMDSTDESRRFFLHFFILRNLEKSCDGFCLKLRRISIYNRTVREKSSFVVMEVV